VNLWRRFNLYNCVLSGKELSKFDESKWCRVIARAAFTKISRSFTRLENC